MVRLKVMDVNTLKLHDVVKTANLDFTWPDFLSKDGKENCYTDKHKTNKHTQKI